MTQQNSGNIQTPDMTAWLNSRLGQLAANINCLQIGTIDSFDATTQTANISLNILRVYKNANPNLPNPTNAPLDITVRYPLLIKCPVVTLNGGGASITFPITQGDTCLVLFNDREIDTWLASGQIAAPQNTRVHDFADGIALVGIRPLTSPLPDFSTTESVWSYLAGLLSAVDSTGERLSQSGDLKATARSTAPSGWLLCYGQSVSKTTYPYLFAAIGYTYGGSGDNFNVPDLRGRIPVGIDNMGGSSANVLTNTYTPNRNTLGGAIGEQTHTLTIPEMPAHTHDVITAGGGGGSKRVDWVNAVDGDLVANAADTRGGSQPHYNVQPGRMFNWCIKI